jgi:hypothetical protein
MYKCKHFTITELVSPSTFETFGENSWLLLDEDALKTLDTIREKFGPTTVNSWSWNGDRSWSGLRTPESPWYSKYSQHTIGRAFDCIFSQTTAEEVREYILENQSEFPLIGGIELGTSWLHFDTRKKSGKIRTFTP